MFYPSAYETKLTKEREIRERIQQAEIDQLARTLRPKGKDRLKSAAKIAIAFCLFAMQFIGQQSRHA